MYECIYVDSSAWKTFQRPSSITKILHRHTHTKSTFNLICNGTTLIVVTGQNNQGIVMCTNEITGTPNNFVIFPFCPSVKVIQINIYLSNNIIMSLHSHTATEHQHINQKSQVPGMMRSFKYDVRVVILSLILIFNSTILN